MNTTTPHFLGNTPKKYKYLVDQAASETGFSIYTGLPLVPFSYGSGLELVGIYSTDTRDHKPFWKRYNELEKEQHK